MGRRTKRQWCEPADVRRGWPPTGTAQHRLHLLRPRARRPVRTSASDAGICRMPHARERLLERICRGRAQAGIGSMSINNSSKPGYLRWIDELDTHSMSLNVIWIIIQNQHSLFLHGIYGYIHCWYHGLLWFCMDRWRHNTIVDLFMCIWMKIFKLNQLAVS